VSLREGAALGLAALSLAACGDPAWRNPAAAGVSTALAPDVQAVLDENARAGRAAVHTDHASPAPLPPPPAWAQGLIGRNVRQAFPRTGACVGNTDGVASRFGSGRAGARVVGWGWDPDRQAPIGRVVLVDEDFRIVGAGDTGMARRDVPRAMPAITSLTTGWKAITSRVAGPLDAYGVKADGQTICKLGHLEL